MEFPLENQSKHRGYFVMGLHYHSVSPVISLGLAVGT